MSDAKRKLSALQHFGYICDASWEHELSNTDVTVYPTRSMHRKKLGCCAPVKIVLRRVLAKRRGRK